jgi:hypothetical protein
MARKYKWLAERKLLLLGYAHVAFTVPRALAGLALQNRRVVYDLLFHASAATLLEVARTPKHLGVALGFLSVLPRWGQTLLDRSLSRRHPMGAGARRSFCR